VKVFSWDFPSAWTVKVSDVPDIKHSVRKGR
jgi:hypothetical protein